MQSLGPETVRSHAFGIGVIWLSSLSVNQAGEYALFIVIVSVVALVALTSVTLAGKPPGVKAPHSVCPTACSMWIQNSTFCAVTGVPSDHWSFFIVIVTCVPRYCRLRPPG